MIIKEVIRVTLITKGVKIGVIAYNIFGSNRYFDFSVWGLIEGPIMANLSWLKNMVYIVVTLITLQGANKCQCCRIGPEADRITVI